MSVEVKIKQKGLFKKKFQLVDIIKLSGLAHGVSDANYCIIPNQVAEHTLLCDPSNPARGIDLSVSKSEVNLLLSLPTTAKEIRSFYQCAAKICAFFKTNQYYREGEKVSIADNEHFIELDTKASRAALEEMQKEYGSDYQHFEIFGAVNPISLGQKELERINGNLDNFAELLRDLQTSDARYAEPKVYDTENGRVGVYAMKEGIPVIFPTKPYIVLNQIENIEAWYVLFAGNETIPYSDFIENVHKEYYDANHVIVTLTKEEKERLIEKYGVEL